MTTPALPHCLAGGLGALLAAAQVDYAFRQYCSRLRAADAVDYADFLALTVQLFRIGGGAWRPLRGAAAVVLRRGNDLTASGALAAACCRRLLPPPVAGVACRRLRAPPLRSVVVLVLLARRGGRLPAAILGVLRGRVPGHLAAAVRAAPAARLPLRHRRRGRRPIVRVARSGKQQVFCPSVCTCVCTCVCVCVCVGLSVCVC